MRTLLQSEWANVYEHLADMIGREIRYGHLPEDPDQREAIATLQVLSTSFIADLEDSRTQLNYAATYVEDLQHFMGNNPDIELPQEVPEAIRADAPAFDNIYNEVQQSIGFVDEQIMEFVEALRDLDARLTKVEREGSGG